MHERIIASAIAAGAVAVLALVIKVAAPTTSGRILRGLVEGADKRLSTSKFQWLVWTVIVVFAFLEVFVERLLEHVDAVDPSVPPNLMIAMGFSATTMAAAKGITAAYAAKGAVDKGLANRHMRKGGLVTDDDGDPDLSKIQLLSFTLIAVVVYLIRLLAQAHPPELVDLDASLMVLMGLSQGAYLGKKLTTTSSPRIARLEPGSGRAGQRVRVVGSDFGEAASGMLLLDGIAASACSWSDTAIEFDWPQTRPAGTPWAAGDRVSVSVAANGTEAPNPTSFVVAA